MIEDLLEEISAAGWLLSNLFQLDSGLWQANLRNATHHTDYGLGFTPAEALEAAIDQMASASEIIKPTQSYSIDQPAFASLFQRPAVKITRRL